MLIVYPMDASMYMIRRAQ